MCSCLEWPSVVACLTLPTVKILSGKNVRAFLVCGFLMKSFKKKIPENMKKNRGSRLDVTY